MTTQIEWLFFCQNSLIGLTEEELENKKEELEEHLSLTSSSVDKIKARRIIERIKQLCVPISLISENKRDKTL